MIDHYDHDGLHFDVTDRGPSDGAPVIALHGFPADRHCWDAVTGRLVAAGYRTLAPDQRGYSPGARPGGRRSYAIDKLGGDVLALADRAGAERFHLVGHDWGAAVGWHLAAAAPDRVATLTAVSVPPAQAMLRALGRSTQALHSWYVLAFQVPGLPELAMGGGGGAVLRRSLRSSGLGAEAADRYARRAAEPGAMTGPIDWYRAIPFAARGRSTPVRVPTTLVWSPGDAFVSRAAIEGAAAWVDAPYRLVEVPDANHWLPEQEPDAVADAVLSQIVAHPL